MSGRAEQKRRVRAVVAARAPQVADDEIDEAVAQLLEYNGVRGWEWREERDHARGMEQIIRQLLAGAFKQTEKPE